MTGAVQRAHVQWSDKGAKRNIYGPFRHNEQGTKEDLESMRAAAHGMDRENGFAAMGAEADRMKACKAPRARGSVEEINGNYRAHFFWKDSDSQRNAYGPRRAEKRRAEEGREGRGGPHTAYPPL